MRHIVVFALTLIFCVSNHTLASIPSLISYQGRLTSLTGDPVGDGVYSLKFVIYDAPVGGSELWSTIGSIPLQVTDGLFSYVLGSQVSLPDSLTRFNSLWLGITVNLDLEIEPRTKLVSVMYSMKTFVAETALHADSATFATFASRADSAYEAGHAGSADRSLHADTAGYIDTSGFSAYVDLESEGRVGPGFEQIASGNHTHQGQMPGPAWKSPWVYVPQSGGLALQHNLEGDSSTYVVDIQCMDMDGGFIGVYSVNNLPEACYYDLTSTHITLKRTADDGTVCDSVRVRIWRAQ